MKKITTPIREGIQAIVDRYPVESGQCSQCASEIYDLLIAEGFAAQIGRIETDYPFLGLADGITVLSDTRPPYHEFVQVDDTIYDSVTGSLGTSLDEYKSLFYEGIFDDGTVQLTYHIP